MNQLAKRKKSPPQKNQIKTAISTPPQPCEDILSQITKIH